MKQVSIIMASCICSQLSVLLVTPNVSAMVSVFDGQQILIDISINVSIIFTKIMT